MNRPFLHYCRLIHVYLTLLGLLVMLFFGVTGFILNHEEWFITQSPKVENLETQIDLKWIETNNKLAIVEKLRDKDNVRGALASFDDLPDIFSLRFESPGQLYNIEINKSDGKTSITHEMHSLWAVMGNLHRGKSCGTAWKWVLDITAILVVIACFTGVVIWIALPKRRKIGIAALIIGIAGTVLIYLICIPGGDCLIK